MSDHANDQLTKAEVGRNKAEKDLAKLTKSIESNTASLEEVEEDLAGLEKKIREKTSALQHIRKTVEEAKDVLEEKSGELAEAKEVLDEKVAYMNKFKAREVNHIPSSHPPSLLLLILPLRLYRLSLSRTLIKPANH